MGAQNLKLVTVVPRNDLPANQQANTSFKSYFFSDI